jgi:hypothetical protein
MLVALVSVTPPGNPVVIEFRSSMLPPLMTKASVCPPVVDDVPTIHPAVFIPLA